MSRTEKARATLRERFLGVAQDRLLTLGDGVSQLSNEWSEDLERTVMREIHTLKGESKLVGFADIGRVAHRTEELLLRLRELPAETRSDAAASALRAIDGLRDMVTTLRASADAPVSALAASLESVIDAAMAPPASPEVGRAAAEPAQGRGSLKQSGWVKPGTDASIRLDLERLHRLTDAVATLRLMHERTELELGHLTESQDAFAREQIDVRAHTYAAELRRTTATLREHSFDFGLRLVELEEDVKSLRLQPISAALRAFPRAMRELAAEVGKAVSIELVGGDVEVDKEVLERLGEPILHLLRNSVDHGIERAEERRAAGKPEVGKICLRARQRGPFVELIVEDDGRGIDPRTIRDVAVRRGILAESLAEGRSDEQLLSLIFEPGFSTAERVTDVSGRGVGLDVVKANVAELGGEVTLRSRLGEGTTFTLTAPILMVVTRALIVRSGGCIFAFPSESVDRVVEAPRDAITSTGRSSVVLVGDELIPLVDLCAANDDSSGERGAVRVVLVRHLDRVRGVRVEELLGERQIVQRSFDDFLADHPLCHGAAILDSGELGLLVDVVAVVSGAYRGVATPGPRAARPDAHARVLVVDDSDITRELVASTLRAHGYETEEAINGRNALERIAVSRPDLVITDLEMPVLDGFGLLAEIRGGLGLESLPVVVFSTRGTESDKRQASQLKADAYLVKSEFSEEDLLGTVRRFVHTDRGAS